MSAPLPKGFEALERFVVPWARDDFNARFTHRYESEMDAIRAFYDAAMPLADKALVELDALDLAALPPAHLTLFQLMMALAHVAVAVERHAQPQPRNITWPTTLRVTQGALPA